MAISLNDPKQRNKLLAGLLPLLILFVYWYMYHGDRVTAINEMKTHLEELDTKNTAAKILAAKGGPELKKKLAVYEQHMVRLEQLIPKSEEVPQLLHSMTLRAEESGVELSLMKPEAEEPGQYYTKATYSMGVIGPYNDVGRFLGAVGSLPRIVTPVNVRLTPRGTEQARGGGQKLDVSFKIQTYVIPKAPPKPAGPPVPPSGAPPKPNA